MKKVYISAVMVFFFAVIFCYFLSTRTSLKLFVESTTADGQSTRYGVDVIKFDAPIGLTATSVNSRPVSSNNCKIQFSEDPKNPVSGQESLYATKDNGGTWTNILTVGGGLPNKIIKYNSPGNYTYTPGSDVKGIQVIIIGGGGGSGADRHQTGGGGGGAIIYIKNPVTTTVSVGSGGPGGTGRAGGTSAFWGYASATGGNMSQGGVGYLGQGVIGITAQGGNPLNAGADVDRVAPGCAFGLSGNTDQTVNGMWPGGGGNSADRVRRWGAGGCVWIFEY